MGLRPDGQQSSRQAARPALMDLAAAVSQLQDHQHDLELRHVGLTGMVARQVQALREEIAQLREELQPPQVEREGALGCGGWPAVAASLLRSVSALREGGDDSTLVFLDDKVDMNRESGGARGHRQAPTGKSVRFSGCD